MLCGGEKMEYVGIAILATICAACATPAASCRRSCAPSCSAAAATSAARPKYEAGELNVRVSVLLALKRLYGCPYDAFFAGLDTADDAEAR